MLRLYLIRHAKSSWDDPHIADRERPLNKRGKKDAPRMGQLLADKGARPDLVLCSPAARAIKTAQILAMTVNYQKNKIKIVSGIYEGDMHHLVEVIKEIEHEFHDVFFIGHNPAITHLANYMTNSSFENIPTCGVVCISFDLLSWNDIRSGVGTLVFFEYPQNIE